MFANIGVQTTNNETEDRSEGALGVLAVLGKDLRPDEYR
jgi:hypothetical protein